MVRGRGCLVGHALLRHLKERAVWEGGVEIIKKGRVVWEGAVEMFRGKWFFSWAGAVETLRGRGCFARRCGDYQRKEESFGWALLRLLEEGVVWIWCRGHVLSKYWHVAAPRIAWKKTTFVL